MILSLHRRRELSTFVQDRALDTSLPYVELAAYNDLAKLLADYEQQAARIEADASGVAR